MRLMSFFGYLDPGTGSIVVQSIIGVVAGVALFSRRLLGRIRDKVRLLFNGSKSIDE